MKGEQAPNILREGVSADGQYTVWLVLCAAAAHVRNMDPALESKRIYREAVEALTNDFATLAYDPAYVRRVQSILTGVRDLPRRHKSDEAPNDR